MSSPMVKAAPGLFSIMTFWLRKISTSAATERARRSVALPGACGTTKRIGRSGKLPCEAAAVGSSHAAQAATVASVSARQFDDAVIAFSPVSCPAKRSERPNLPQRVIASSTFVQPRADPLHRLVHLCGRAGVAEPKERRAAQRVEVDPRRRRDVGVVEHALGEDRKSVV